MSWGSKFHWGMIISAIASGFGSMHIAQAKNTGVWLLSVICIAGGGIVFVVCWFASKFEDD
jgi:hypothetical protein